MLIYIVKAIVCDQGSNLVKIFCQLCFTEEEINTITYLHSQAQIEKWTITMNWKKRTFRQLIGSK